ncbi:hypothetical protein D9613_004665 [Agrocybe pediades]|uniref:Cytochrome P450 n=1 Tax=Agrocybe pediades TaxID=84607 RepID=A0A8H4R0B6_9AGAR|nr:hypothetical protein D9613_004665 [Agrocybe pediades]
MQSYLFPLLLVPILWSLQKLVRWLTKSQPAPYPPGPKPKFLIGNALDIPSVKSSKVYVEWEKKYNSKILHAEALGNHILVLNSLEDADELLEKRSKNYSDRPHIPLVKILGWEFNISLMQFDDVWRLHRKICQQNFRKGASEEYDPVHVSKVNDFLVDLLSTPNSNLETNIKKLSIAIPLASMYGYHLESLDDPCVIAAEKSASEGGNLLITATYVNAFPFLGRLPTWVPFAKASRIAEEVRKNTKEMMRIPTEKIKKLMAEGKASPSLVTSMLERKFSSGITAEEEATIENIAYTVYGAASGTTTASMATFFHLMSKHRDIQRKAQAEIDEVVGTKRLPGYEDRPRLPYIEAIYREVMRIAAPLPLSVPHATLEDDIYKGYFIPKGTTVAMNHDPEKYTDPDAFKPERFFDASGKLNDDGRILAYGFGRRVCVGQHVASSIMWLVIVSVLACFDIGAPEDDDGNELPINEDYEEVGIVRYKINLGCSVKARSRDTAQLVTNLRME